MSNFKAIYNIDWLELFCIESRADVYIDELRHKGFKVIKQPYGTRVYRQIYDVLSPDDTPLFHITRDPYSVKGKGKSGVMKQGSCHVKVGNWCLYQANYLDGVEQFLFACGLQVQSVSRVDVCCDLQQFYDGTLPSRLLAGYMKGKYHKVGQSKFQAHGEDKGDKIISSMKWGSESSDVHARMYNKTKELYEVKDKPYIRDQWDEAGFSRDKATWRIEFEIHAKGRSMVEWEDGTIHEVTLDSLASPEKIQELFERYATHYFDWRKAKEGVRKDRCPKKLLFPDGERKVHYHPMPNTRSAGATRFVRMVQKFLMKELELKDEKNWDDRFALMDTMRVLSTKYRLQDWMQQNNDHAITKGVENPLAERMKSFYDLVADGYDINT